MRFQPFRVVQGSADRSRPSILLQAVAPVPGQRSPGSDSRRHGAGPRRVCNALQKCDSQHANALSATGFMDGHGPENDEPDYIAETGASLGFFRNERNIYACRPKEAQVAVIRAWHEAEHAIVNQRDDPTWISSFPRVAKSLPRNVTAPRPEGRGFLLQAAAGNVPV